MDNVFDIMDRLPKSGAEHRVFSPHFVDLRFLQRMIQSILWGWASRHGDVPVPLPQELQRRMLNTISRHVSGVGQVVIEEDSDSYSFCFTASGKGGTYSYTLEVDTTWAEAQ